jgi:hypothetical protein
MLSPSSLGSHPASKACPCFAVAVTHHGSGAVRVRTASTAGGVRGSGGMGGRPPVEERSVALRPHGEAVVIELEGIDFLRIWSEK